MGRIRNDLVSSSFQEMADFMADNELPIIVLTNDYFYFGDICKFCGDIAPDTTKYHYPSELGEDIDMFELEDQLNGVLPEKNIVCENDAVICSCKDKGHIYDDDEDYNNGDDEDEEEY